MALNSSGRYVVDMCPEYAKIRYALERFSNGDRSKGWVESQNSVLS